MVDLKDRLQATLGSTYTIEREIGSGGMATVYLAHDKKHDRKVAIKVLHAELAAALGSERFLQEIKVTANLQHPHILSLIDSGVISIDESGSRPYYVMPYVDGESLRQRLEREQQLPVADGVRIAREVAAALDYAHRHGVIHRDIKPENILLNEGSAIVADFGIALALTQAGGVRMTQTGIALGTPTYMSPEQAMGERTITARSDIYSLGAVTYEMLSGEPPFTGPNAQAIVGRALSEEPRRLTTQRRSIPTHVEDAIFRALEKLPADRFASAHEYAEALNNPLFGRDTPPAARSGTLSNPVTWVFYGAAALAALILANVLWGWMRPAPSKVVARYGLMLDSTEGMAQGTSYWGRGRLALSPDGSRLAYIGGPRAQLLIRRRDQLHATAIPGTEGAYTPFFSPDGQHVGFVTGDTLQVVSLNGDPPITVADSVMSASWGREGFIYGDALGGVGLVRVEAKSGAAPRSFTVLDKGSGEIDHKWPDALPNGKGVLFTVILSEKNGGSDRLSNAIAVADIPSGKHRVVMDDAIYARYAVSGHLLYVTTNRTLMVVPFDQNSMRVAGEPTTLIEDLRLGSSGAADLAVSERGTLIYATGAEESNQELVWVTRDGKAESVDREWQGYFRYPALSPDGKRLAVARSATTQTGDIWIKQLDRGPSIKLTREGAITFPPTWTPDGRSVTFSSNAGGPYDLWTKRADGSAPAVLQAHERRNGFISRWSHDGKWLIFQTNIGQRGLGDVLGIRPGIDTIAVPLVATRFTEVSPALSPDGRWLAYTSDESGELEIYVVPFPNTGAAKWAVSTGGGAEPQWSHSGNELFYRDASGNLVAVEVRTRPGFSIVRSAPLFSATGFFSFQLSPQYEVSLDDRRFLMIRPLAGSTPDKLIVVENLFEELNAKARK